MDFKDWRDFLFKYESHGAHFHGEGDPPDLILEMRPEPDSDHWLVAFRPPGFPDTSEVRNEMRREILEDWAAWRQKCSS